MCLLKLLAIFVQISMLLAQMGHPECGKPNGKRGGSGATGHSTGASSTTTEHAWSVAIVIPNPDCIKKECDEYGYDDEGYECEAESDYDSISDIGSRTDAIGGGKDCPETKLHCSGSILDERTIVTAAHCFVDDQGNEMSTKDMTVIVGANEPTNPKSLKKRRRFVAQKKIKSFKLHSKYNKNTKAAYHDVALVEIRGRFKFKNTVWPICIPDAANNKRNEWEQKGLTLAAYGENIHNDAKEVLTAEQFIGQKDEYCSGLYRTSPFEPEHEKIQTSLPRLFDDSTIFCAKVPGSNAGTCPGDSGGPLLNYKFFSDIQDNRAIQVGVVHGSIKACDGTRFPSIFSRLDNYEILKWIVEEVFPRQTKKIVDPATIKPPSGGGGPAGPVEGSLTEETFEDKECARRATSSVHSACLEWKSKADQVDGPVEERDGGKCIYNCSPNDGMHCRVNFEKPKFNGKTKGLCFPNGKCFGTPTACQDCTEKCS